jgi:hypothetical protein
MWCSTEVYLFAAILAVDVFFLLLRSVLPQQVEIMQKGDTHMTEQTDFLESHVIIIDVLVSLSVQAIIAEMFLDAEHLHEDDNVVDAVRRLFPVFCFQFFSSFFMVFNNIRE